MWKDYRNFIWKSLKLVSDELKRYLKYVSQIEVWCVCEQAERAVRGVNVSEQGEAYNCVK